MNDSSQIEKATTEEVVSAKKSEPREVIPTERVGFARQLQLLQAYVHGSENGTKPVSVERVAEIAKVHPSTVSPINPFFTKVGFITKQGREYLPSAEVLDYVNAVSWEQPNPTEKLFPIIERSWFGQLIKPRLSMGSMDVHEIISELALKAGVGKEFRSQLETIVEYMVECCFARRDGNTLTLVRRNGKPQIAGVNDPSPVQLTKIEPIASNQERYPLKVNGVEIGELILKVSLSPEEIETVWKKLAALKSWVMAQSTDEDERYNRT